MAGRVPRGGGPCAETSPGPASDTVDPRKRLDRGISCVTSWRAMIRDLASGTDKFHLVSRLTSYGEDVRTDVVR